MNFEKQYENVE